MRTWLGGRGRKGRRAKSAEFHLEPHGPRFLPNDTTVDAGQGRRSHRTGSRIASIPPVWSRGGAGGNNLILTRWNGTLNEVRAPRSSDSKGAPRNAAAHPGAIDGTVADLLERGGNLAGRPTSPYPPRTQPPGLRLPGKRPAGEPPRRRPPKNPSRGFAPATKSALSCCLISAPGSYGTMAKQSAPARAPPFARATSRAAAVVLGLLVTLDPVQDVGRYRRRRPLLSRLWGRRAPIREELLCRPPPATGAEVDARTRVQAVLYRAFRPDPAPPPPAVVAPRP